MKAQHDSITHRPATAEDDAFFRNLYQSSRGDDLRGLGWDEDRINEFLAMQYEAQREFYASDHGSASDEVVLLDSKPIGRLIVARLEDEIRCVEMALLPDYRSRGLGTVLISNLQAESIAAQKPLRLQVIRFNRALRLFERMGFARTSETGTHFQMEWKPT